MTLRRGWCGKTYVRIRAVSSMFDFWLSFNDYHVSIFRLNCWARVCGCVWVGQKYSLQANTTRVILCYCCVFMQISRDFEFCGIWGFLWYFCFFFRSEAVVNNLISIIAYNSKIYLGFSIYLRGHGGFKGSFDFFHICKNVLWKVSIMANNKVSQCPKVEFFL